jgi:hypothetical protein
MFLRGTQPKAQSPQTDTRAGGKGPLSQPAGMILEENPGPLRRRKPSATAAAIIHASNLPASHSPPPDGLHRTDTEKCQKEGNVMSSLLLEARRATQTSLKFIRWLRQCLRDHVAEAAAVPRLIAL